MITLDVNVRLKDYNEWLEEREKINNIFTIQEGIEEAPKAPDYMQLQTLNLLNEWQHYKRNVASMTNISLEGYIKRKYGFTAEKCYFKYDEIRRKLDKDYKQ